MIIYNPLIYMKNIIRSKIKELLEIESLTWNIKLDGEKHD